MADPTKKKQKLFVDLAQRKILTPEEILARAFRAKCRFRAIVRFVIQNLFWLQDIEESELSDNVQKNVFLLVHKKGGTKGLKLKDKYLLTKNAEERTEAEREYLFNSIGSLKCFRKYPKEVKSQLPGITYFHYYGPDRVIVREGDPSYALYFIVTGNVTISAKTVDPISKDTVTMILGVLGPDSMFGEVALMKDIPRTATITTNTHCELLCLRKHDFDTVLKGTIQERWAEIESSLKLFTYFQKWDELALRECCLLSKINVYTPGQTILGDGEGLTDHVHFVLTGKCQVIEHLLVIPYFKNGYKHYKLYEPPLVDKVSVMSMKSLAKESSKRSSTKTDGSRRSKVTLSKKVSDSKSIRKIRSNRPISSITESNVTASSFFQTLQYQTMELSYLQADSTTSSNQLKVGSKLSGINVPDDVETHFMQVCFFLPTACFGITENMKNRRIVATVETKCLLIPRYWLMQQSKSFGVWNKVSMVLNALMPSTKQVFEDFINQRKYMAYRKKLVRDLFKRKLGNFNRIENVPYFIRLHAINYE